MFAKRDLLMIFTPIFVWASLFGFENHPQNMRPLMLSLIFGSILLLQFYNKVFTNYTRSWLKPLVLFVAIYLLFIALEQVHPISLPHAPNLQEIFHTNRFKELLSLALFPMYLGFYIPFIGKAVQEKAKKKVNK